jgi:CheY-like chemotaxis protein
MAILDMQMPEMDGMELARKIKSDPALASTRLVLLTSMGQRGDAKEAGWAGIEAYLTKPVRQSELYDALATVMGTSDQDKDNASKPDKRLVTRHSTREAKAQSRGRVLIAEDNPVNQKVALRMLEKLGYRVDVVGDGRQAVEALEHSTYAVVLMDVQMPEMDGYEATAEIRRREGEELHTPIIAMTANALQGDREKALEADMDDYIPKPVKSEELEALLERWVSKEGVKAAALANGNGLPVSEETGPSLDAVVVESLRDLGGDEMLSELTQLFFDDADSNLAALKEAIEKRDGTSVERVAHALKGSSGNMGATRMAELCGQLQDAGASGYLVLLQRYSNGLEEEFEHDFRHSSRSGGRLKFDL